MSKRAPATIDPFDIVEEPPAFVRIEPSVTDESGPRKWLITPALAEEWLKLSPAFQRRIDRPTIEKYKLDLINGNWRLLGDSNIVRSKSGKLLNGHHRLIACVESGVSFECYVLENAAEEGYVYMDQCRPRSVQEMISAGGKASDGILLKRLVSNVHSYRNNQFKSTAKFLLSISNLGKLTSEFPNLLKALADVIAAFPGKDPLYRQRPVICEFYFYLLQAKPELAPNFLAKIQTGSGLGDDDPILHFRNRLTSDRSAATSKKKLILRMAGIKVINSLIENKPMLKLSVKEMEECADVIGFPPLDVRPDA